MRWGMQTCGGAACDAKRKASCTRRLACGHFCCGVRSEERHPRCPACAPAPGLHSSLEQADVGASLDCCFCWSPLASAPCIELACIGRHLVHLECAVRPRGNAMHARMHACGVVWRTGRTARGWFLSCTLLHNGWP